MSKKASTSTKAATRTPKKRKLSDNDSNLKIKQPKLSTVIIEPIWKDHDLLAEIQNIHTTVAKNVIQLFDDNNTVPFIARYRRAVTGNLDSEQLRKLKETYEEINKLKLKIKLVAQEVHKVGELSPHIQNSIISVRSLDELDHIHAPFKQSGKRTLAARAKEVGLEEPALQLLYGSKEVDLNQYICLENKELNSIKQVEKGIMHIIAAIVATNSEVFHFLRHLKSQVNFGIETKKSKAKRTDADKKQLDESKFENYFDYKNAVKYLKPHQILAINRAESHKILSVKVTVPDIVFRKFISFCSDKWMKGPNISNQRQTILQNAFNDSYERLVQPFIIRVIRCELKLEAEKASYEVFSSNLQQLLLAAPLKGKPILAIDPGFSNGCKLALVSSTGRLLNHKVIYPFKSSGTKAAKILFDMLEEEKCNLIAIGNGTACRQTEEWLTNLIHSKYFHPLDVTYTIVNEDGASIYSCSPEATKEFPDTDPNIISAVSLARRLQDPLAELVKVQPQHLGVGMYQHDMKKSKLEAALDEVVSECVSFVGVDLNTASQCLLRRIAGLSEKRALHIIQYRDENGPFICRKELTSIKGIGARIFEQCAGFLRVGPTQLDQVDKFYKNANTTKLDCTIIHPESYTLTYKLIKRLDLSKDQIGETDFINKFRAKINKLDISKLSEELSSNEETLKVIIDGLTKPLNYDLRNECSQVPLFRKSLTNINDLKCGTILTGRVSNVTNFGCFVDVGVGTNGLIHSSKMNRLNIVLGDKVEVKVVKIEIAKKRISLEALKKL